MTKTITVYICQDLFLLHYAMYTIFQIFMNIVIMRVFIYVTISLEQQEVLLRSSIELKYFSKTTAQGVSK